MHDDFDRSVANPLQTSQDCGFDFLVIPLIDEFTVPHGFPPGCPQYVWSSHDHLGVIVPVPLNGKIRIEHIQCILARRGKENSNGSHPGIGETSLIAGSTPITVEPLLGPRLVVCPSNRQVNLDMWEMSMAV
jgi:hypothetical protein